MKNKRFLLTIFMMAIVGWQSAFALELTQNGLVFTTKNGTANQVSVRAAATGLTANVVIPAQVQMFAGGDMYTVVEIEDGAFSTGYDFTNVTIPATVNKIGEYAFVNCNITTLNILRDENSTLTIGRDAFGGSVIVNEVVWGGTIKQWCEVSFENLYANPIAVKKEADGSVNTSTVFPTLTLTTPIEYINSEASSSASAVSITSTRDEIIGTTTKSTSNAVKVSGKTVDYKSGLLVLPADVVTINDYAFANRTFAKIKTLGNAPTVSTLSFTNLNLTTVYVQCPYVSAYNSDPVWSTASSRTTYVEYTPGDIVRNSNYLIYSDINHELMATIRYTKPSCSNNQQWTLTAVMEPGYQFSRWSGSTANTYNGNTNATISGGVDDVMPVTAFIDRIVYNINLASNDNAMGSIGSNSQISAYYNDNVILNATPNTGYRFVRWSNGDSRNPLTITVTDNATYTAYFEADNTVATEDQYALSSYTNNESNLWRTYGDGRFTWSVNASDIKINKATTGIASTPAYAYRKLKLNADTYYTLQFGGTYSHYSYQLQYALIPWSNDNASDDYAEVIANTTWNTVDGNTINIAPLATDGYYFLTFRYRANSTTSAVVTLSNITFAERKFKVKAVMVPEVADGTVSEEVDVFSSHENVVLTASMNNTNATGYEFMGWYDNAACTGTALSNSANYTVSAPFTDDLTYYAKYEAKPVRITYSSTSGQAYSNGSTYTSYQNLAATLNTDIYSEYELDYYTYYGYNTNYRYYYASDDPVNITYSGSYINGKHDQEIVVAVAPIDGYEFEKWSDGNTDNPRTITLSRTANNGQNMMTLKPVFKEKADYAVTVVVKDIDQDREDNTMGTVTGAGTYAYKGQVTLTATPSNAAYYKFEAWVDGHGYVYTENPLTFNIQGNNGIQNNEGRQFTAYFSINNDTIDILPENNEQGNVEFASITPNAVSTANWIEGEGRRAVVKYRSSVKIKATPVSGYHFAGWTKVGSPDTIPYIEYTFIPTQNERFTALFEADSDLPVINDTIWNITRKDTIVVDTQHVSLEVHVPVTVYDETHVPLNIYDTIHHVTTLEVTDTVIIPVYQTQTVITYDTVYETRTVVKDSIVVNEVIVNNPVYHDTVIYITSYQPQYVDTVIYNYINQPVYHYVDTTIYNPVYIDVPYYDTVIVNIDTVYTICTTDTIINTVVDTVINNVHDTTIVYSYDTIYLPVYDTVYIHDTVYVGINDAAQNDNINVYQSGNQIVVNGTESNVVRLFDAVGRMLATKQDPYGEVYFEAPATGTYLVKVGNYQAKRIVVVL